MDFQSLSVLIPIVISLGMNTMYHIPWSSLFLFLQPFHIYLYEIIERETCLQIQKNITYSTHKTSEKGAYGYCFGRWFFGYVNRSYGDWSITLLANEQTFKRLTQTQQVEETVKLNYTSLEKEENNPTNLRLIKKGGTFGNSYFSKREVEVGFLEPLPQQQTILEQIQLNQERFGYSIVFLHGPPGTGKSMIAHILAQRAKGHLFTNLNLVEPGTVFDELYTFASPTKSKPLIVLLDEVDILLKQIHEQKVLMHKHYPSQIQDKSGWNRFLDSIQIGLFPNLILLMTSNKSPEEINKLDPCYLRENRVDFTFHLTEVIQD